MLYKKIEHIVALRGKNKTPFQVTLRGISMNPILYDGDIITVQKNEKYKTGDILLFPFKDDGLLIHRFLKRDGDNFICKGDNTFRFETVERECIIGRVIAASDSSGKINRKDISGFLKKIVCFCSYIIGVKFSDPLIDVNVKKTFIYKIYKKIYLDKYRI